MLINWLNNLDPRPTEEPLMALVSIDGKNAYVSLLDEGVEHSVLLRKMVSADADIEQYYRIVFNPAGADWTFICPPGYKGIPNKEYRIKTFYNDGYNTLCEFLKEIGYPQEIEIPKRYQRHIDYLTNNDYEI